MRWKLFFLFIIAILLVGLIMKKTSDEELNQWRFDQRRAPVSIFIVGDQNIGMKWLGEALSLLFSVKNAMIFNKLMQHQDQQVVSDGTIIRVKSIYGMDFIEIDTSLSTQIGAVAAIPSCSIEILNLPKAIPPMKWYQDGVHEGEIERIDFIKTYYRFNIASCPKCDDLEFSICTTQELNADIGLTNIKKCKPFIYHDPSIPIRESFADNHCIYSLSGCQAEIIQFGKDEGGTFFLWKAYTEWSNLGPTIVIFSRNGFGYLLFRGSVKLNGTELCKSEDIIVMVDCCLKSKDKRGLVMYWERDCGPNENCPVPHEIPKNTLYLPTYFFVKPELGSCIPYQWALKGSGRLIFIGDFNQYAEYYPPGIFGCNEEINISVQDRCGTQYNVKQKACCGDVTPLEMGYTSLLMSCSGAQTLSAIGGCPPYEWSLTGGGTLVPQNGPEYATAIYYAPATNPNCSLNPTITVNECCGQSASISLTVNCYTGDEAAFKEFAVDVYYSTCAYVCNGYFSGCTYTPYWHRYRCDGSYKDDVGWDWESGSGPAWKSCTGIGTDCSSPCSQFPGTLRADSPDPSCPENDFPYACGDIVDIRTEAMKDEGCCPINPLTGLPF
jgi:hypothetical protein